LLRTPLLFFFLLLCASAGTAQTPSPLQDGDILFQKLPCGSLCDAIIATTPCAEDRRFNHCGIVHIVAGKPFVIEAIGSRVQQTPLQKFLARDTAVNISAGRPHWNNKKEGKQAAVQAAKFVGRPYDDAFLPGDTALYCSELVWEVSKRGSKKLFRLEPMTFKTGGNTHPDWIIYYNNLGVAPPEGVLGINPCGLANSPELDFWQIAKGK
jgi:hypothetical protein